ncbi:peptide chain release factor 1-like, mitochondrial isoform X1 [Poecile atricapillus]|uniref:peptide chain release factor 1-like, mitochondrial isoform X1 n=2 Tax=Poecile atricapillus TaxID=48891 RepID=UPI0027398B62|nr:peptide chain release factor 1-like, mitochondrial isoform X1 [Poecile atricapillus]
MRLLSRALRAAQAYRAAALPPRSLRAAPVGRPLPARRGLSARPGLEELFAAPSLRRLLEARARGEGGAAPQLAARVRRLRDKERELRDTRELAQDENEDFRKLAETEIASCEEEIAELKQQIVLLLIPSEETDESDLVMEVTAGVGGQEAMLFTSEIFDMYQRYAAYKKWKFEVLEYFPSEIGGLRHAVASIAGVEAYKYMKFEGGVHRVQRVPKTEKQGRIHTSTMTVAILPQPTEMRLQISPKDLRIETKRASGAGGQHVNTTDSAVRIVHIPTGIVSECQQERSQIRNKEKAMQMLCAKLYNAKLEEETKKRNSARKIQIGTKGRSEKIRTYNFPQDRITDHRISRSVHHVESFMLGEEMLDEMIQTLREYADYESLMEIISENEKKHSS